MRDTGVVHEQVQRLGRRETGHRVDAVVGREVRGDGGDRHLRVRGSELVEAILPAADEDQVVAVRGKALSESCADTGRGAGDQSKFVHVVHSPPAVLGQVVASAS
ncbi:hypothetical protein GCM10029976_006540 [Kribbella albertanoniae]